MRLQAGEELATRSLDSENSLEELKLSLEELRCTSAQEKISLEAQLEQRQVALQYAATVAGVAFIISMAWWSHPY